MEWIVRIQSVGSYNWKSIWIYIDETKDEERKCTI